MSNTELQINVLNIEDAKPKTGCVYQVFDEYRQMQYALKTKDGWFQGPAVVKYCSEKTALQLCNERDRTIPKAHRHLFQSGRVLAEGIKLIYQRQRSAKKHK